MYMIMGPRYCPKGESKPFLVSEFFGLHVSSNFGVFFKDLMGIFFNIFQMGLKEHRTISCYLVGGFRCFWGNDPI